MTPLLDGESYRKKNGGDYDIPSRDQELDIPNKSPEDSAEAIDNRLHNYLLL